MKKNFQFFVLSLLLIMPSITVHANDKDAFNELVDQYVHNAVTTSDINEHLPTLKNLAKQCSSVTEIGVRSMVATWALLYGLTTSESQNVSYVGIDLDLPPLDNFSLANHLAEANGISFTFWQANDMTIDIAPTDLLFIDSLHTYCHLTYELEKFSSKALKFIALHDTSSPWGNRDEDIYYGNYSEYPTNIDRFKRGLWPAVEDFLKRHPEWKLQKRYFNNHGFTVLERVK